MFARRQLEHGEFLSQRTFRFLQITQLRGFGADPDAVAGAGASVGPEEVALFSASAAEGSPVFL